MWANTEMCLSLTGKLEITLMFDNMGLSYINFDTLTLGTQQTSERMSTSAAEMWSLDQPYHFYLELVKMQFPIQ